MDMYRKTNYNMRYSEGLDMPGVSDLTSAWDPEGTRTNQASRVVKSTKNPVLQYAQSATFVLFVEASLFSKSGWFHIHLFLFI